MSQCQLERIGFTFAMGEFTAEFPRDRHYATNHMWAKQVHARRWRFGLTAYAVRLLQDVYFLDWIVEPPAESRRAPHRLDRKQEGGE